MIEKTFEIKSEWLFFPVWNVAGEEPEKETLEIFCEEPEGRKKLFEFQVLAKVPGAEENCPIRYYARFPVKQFTDKTLILRGELPEAFSMPLQQMTLWQWHCSKAVLLPGLRYDLRSILPRRPDG